MMLKVLLYGYVIGVRWSRDLEKACVERVAFRFLAANQTPNHRAFSRFRERHLTRGTEARPSGTAGLNNRRMAPTDARS